MLAYLEENPAVFFGIFLVVAAVVLAMFYFGGKKADAGFPDPAEQEIAFRERGASGYSTKSALTRIGGANRVLDVVVTSSELWIKGIIPAFTYIGTKYDLTHRVLLSDIREAKEVGEHVSVTFLTGTGATTNVHLSLRNPEAFIKAVAA